MELMHLHKECGMPNPGSAAVEDEVSWRAWYSVAGCEAAGWQSCSPEGGGNSYYKMYLLSFPSSKAGVCVLKISLQYHSSVNMATPHVEAEILSSSFPFPATSENLFSWRRFCFALYPICRIKCLLFSPFCGEHIYELLK